MTNLAGATTTEAVGADLVLVPVGSTEQHGPHLPLDTDTAIATATAGAAAAQLDGAWVAPALAYGSSGEHQSFAGTSSIGGDALARVIVELTRSLRTWAHRVVFVNAHGGNVVALSRAVGEMVAEGHWVEWVPCQPQGADLHAGRTETSLMLHLRPGSVHQDRAVAGNVRPLHELLPKMVANGVGAVSPSGVLGDPTGASAAEGRHLLEAMTAHVVRAIRAGKS